MRGKRPAEHRDEQLLNKASEMLTTVGAQISRKESVEDEQP